MDDTFRVRVDKIFGSLSSNSSVSSSSLTSLWCLNDEDVQRKDCTGHKEHDSDNTVSSITEEFSDIDNNFLDEGFQNQQELLEDTVHDLDDRSEDLQLFFTSSKSHKSSGYDGGNDDEWEIRSSIGLDCTLDKEEEEDEYDKVAIGKENSGDRLYMQHVNDYQLGVNSYKSLPTAFRNAARDPRANHVAAKIRLEEDAEAAKDFDSLHVTDSLIKVSENEVNPKPILKRKEGKNEGRSEKRVRFDPTCKNVSVEELESEKVVEINQKDVPDYVKNPSKYTCYTFDSSEVDDKSNQGAYMDFVSLLKKPSMPDSQMEERIDVLKHVTFVPRKKVVGDGVVREKSEAVEREGEDGDGMVRKGLSIHIAAGYGDESQPGNVEDDSVVRTGGHDLKKSARQYRTKVDFDAE